jgi:hypothetical protein
MIYNITLKQKTEAVGDISANALLGAFLTAVSDMEDVTEGFVDSLAFSDLFPKGILPIGVKNNHTVYSGNKKKRCMVTRTMISRAADGNNNPVMLPAWITGEVEFYLSTDYSKEDLEMIIPKMLLFGLGKFRNVGKGQFELLSIEEHVFPEVQNGVALSSFQGANEVSDDDVIETGYYVRNAMTTSGMKQPPICMILTGTKFKFGNRIIGKHFYDAKSNTYIHGKAIIA